MKAKEKNLWKNSGVYLSNMILVPVSYQISELVQQSPKKGHSMLLDFVRKKYKFPVYTPQPD